MEALSNNYALLCNIKKAKLLWEEKVSFDEMLKQVEQIITLSKESNWGNLEFNKGKNVETAKMGNGNEIKTLCESTVNKAANMAAG